MEFDEHVGALRREGELLAATAAGSNLDAPVPTCPGWVVRDLIRHIGDVHRWATAHVAEARSEPIGREELVGLVGPLPDDDGLTDWFREGHARLVRTLQTADPDIRCWSFLPAPSPLAFWARRQAHETGIHRADAESANGSITPFSAAFGADGVDELLFGFLGRGRVRGPTDGGVGEPCTLHLHATDTDGEWLVRVDGDGAATTRGHADARCTVAASASDLDLLLWNRRSPEGMEVTGDRSVLTDWRETVRITWSRDR